MMILIIIITIYINGEDTHISMFNFIVQHVIQINSVKEELVDYLKTIIPLYYITVKFGFAN